MATWYFVNNEYFVGDEPKEVEVNSFTETHVSLKNTSEGRQTKRVLSYRAYFPTKEEAEAWLLTKNPSRIAIVKEKHGTYYYDISTAAKRNALGLYLLNERQRMYKVHGKEPEPTFTKIDEAVLATMPDAYVDQHKKELDIYARNLSYYRAVVWFNTQVTKALATKNGQLAWNLLMRRSDYEYETIEIETPTNPLKMGLT